MTEPDKKTGRAGGVLLSLLLGFRIIPPLERYPKLVSFVQTVPGKALLLGCYALLAAICMTDIWLPVTACICLFTFFPGRRWLILLAATLGFAIFEQTDFLWGNVAGLLAEAGLAELFAARPARLAAVAAVLLFCSFCVYLARQSRLAPRIKRPVALLLLSYSGVLCLASYLPMPPLPMALTAVFFNIFTLYLWFLCYSLKECKAPRPAPFASQLGHYLPFWFPHDIPIPKGRNYLRKIEAKSGEELAISQLKGLKLGLWALLLHTVAALLQGTLYGQGEFFGGDLQVHRYLGTIGLYFRGEYLFDLIQLPFPLSAPRYGDAFNLAAAGSPLPWHLNWIALLCYFFLELLEWSVGGHFVISLVRMAGFNALRNTFSPLKAHSIAEFWNRYVYYYKELLVEFFYYPVFFRYFKKCPMLRMYVATMSAACFGNFLYHFFKYRTFILEKGFFQALLSFQPLILYMVVLGHGIFVSQFLQERRKGRQRSRLARALAPVGVVLFFCLIGVFGDDNRRLGMSDHMAFFLSLFRIF